MRRLKEFKVIALILMVCFVVLSLAPDIEAKHRRRHWRNREAGKGKAAKRIGVGAAIGAGAGAIIGGKKGAVIGAGAGAGAGAAYHVHKKRSYRRRHR
ncbi:MAG TPA: hypothetical protein VJZ26_16025 [Blastocatellia bacterium]|nr:hypothetical protein [Blastocatellia bacterium]